MEIKRRLAGMALLIHRANRIPGAARPGRSQRSREQKKKGPAPALPVRGLVCRIGAESVDTGYLEGVELAEVPVPLPAQIVIELLARLRRSQSRLVGRYRRAVLTGGRIDAT